MKDTQILLYLAHLGSASFLTDSDGDAYEFFLYLPWGETLVEQKVADFSTPYQFNGKELDKVTGLYNYGARYYDPSLSLWLAPDPLADKMPQWSPYNYTFNNPIRFIDPDGREPEVTNQSDPPNKLREQLLRAITSDESELFTGLASDFGSNINVGVEIRAGLKFGSSEANIGASTFEIGVGWQGEKGPVVKGETLTAKTNMAIPKYLGIKADYTTSRAAFSFFEGGSGDFFDGKVKIHTLGGLNRDLISGRNSKSLSIPGGEFHGGIISGSAGFNFTKWANDSYKTISNYAEKKYQKIQTMMKSRVEWMNYTWR